VAAAILNSITIMAYFVGMSRKRMTKALYRICVAYASRGNEFPFAMTICDVELPILVEYEQRVIVKFFFHDRSNAP
jgi:hypothetical protein